MNHYLGEQATGTRHIDGWENIMTAENMAEKVAKKLRRNADNELDDETDEEPEDIFKETAEFFKSED